MKLSHQPAVDTGYPALSAVKRQTLRQLFALEYVNQKFNMVDTCKVMEINYYTGKRLLETPEVRKLISEMAQRQLEARGVTTDKIISEISRVAFANLGDFLDESGEIDVSKLKGAAAIAEINTTEYEGDSRVVTRRKIKLHDKLRALELLGKSQAMFTDKVEVDGLDSLAEELKAARLRVEQDGPDKR